MNANKRLGGKSTPRDKGNIVEEEMEDDIEEEEVVGENEGDSGFTDDGRKKKSVAGKRGPSGARETSPPSCQAEKCGANLSEAKRYHRRHKVCEVHAKAPSVIVAGLRQRFCQQCSRFHELTEFDEAKRSCRRRLAGHNERRRKSSAEFYGESSGCRTASPASKLKPDSQCRDADERGRVQILPQGNSTSFKHFQIR
ncbi:squamosa promoter-binding protein 1 [Punica granatum]|uniref:Uncharacterized protein n=2 Tax=Punica granatum TaxID=22663 RepID=A0A2I0JJ38_PUNGR|nr:squamosa promoter-binding protein 1 [Punica granatum]PKI56272.1 hypothetical protein CRG98_023291 [Punica granatum]